MHKGAVGLRRAVGADDDKCHGAGEKSGNTAVSHQAFINAHMKFIICQNDDGGNSNGCCHDLVSLSVGLRGSGVDIADHAANSSSPAPATKVGMEEGCITAKAVDIPMKNVFFQAC